MSKIDKAQKRLDKALVEASANKVFINPALVREHLEAVRPLGMSAAATRAACYQTVADLLEEYADAARELACAYADNVNAPVRVVNPRGTPPRLAGRLSEVNRNVERQELVSNPAKAQSVMSRLVAAVR